MKTAMAGSSYTLAAGQLVERDEKTAERWVGLGIAEYVDAKTPPAKKATTPAKRAKKATSKKAKTSEKR